MANRPQSDIPQSQISVPASTDAIAKYAKFFSLYGLSVLDYAQAYSTNRLQHSQRSMSGLSADSPLAAGIRIAQASLLSKVLLEAQFTPAHPGRYDVGRMTSIDKVVLHRPGSNPGACTFENTIATFLVPPALEPGGRKTQSTQFIIGPQGQLVQMVDLADGAHHVGRGNLNYTSVGVEITGAIQEVVTDAQLGATADLIAKIALIGGFEIGTGTVLKHSNLDSSRRDPGPNLDYAGLLVVAKQRKRFLVSLQTNNFFKSPFDPKTAVTQDIHYLIDSANAARGPNRKALALSSASRIESIFRADQMANVTRQQISGAAQVQSEHIATNQADDTGVRVFNSEQAKSAEAELVKRQQSAAANSAVVGYNLVTGLWSDGGHV